MDISELSIALCSQVEAELQSGERITWVDQPIPGRMARTMVPLVLFGIPWTAFAIFWVAGAAKAGGGGFFPLFGVPFILIGLGLLSSPYWTRRAARRSIYALTDRRAIVIQGSWWGSITVRSFESAQLTDLQRKQNPDGSGDLIFSQEVRRDSDGDRRVTNIGFMGIRDVKAVEEKVGALAKRHETAV